MLSIGRQKRAKGNSSRKKRSTPPRSSARRLELLSVAAALFAKKGYTGTSIRDVAEVYGVLSGSLYHHVDSKEALYIESHGLVINEAAQRLREVTQKYTEPWDKLRAACEVTAEFQLDPTSLKYPMLNHLMQTPKSMRKTLVAQRNRFENIFSEIIKTLQLDPTVERSIFRLSLITALNGSSVWYRRGRLTPKQVGTRVFEIFHHCKR
jgi:TetR/AcrR family transcriptional regulator, cholesterol catabolism regulator